MTDNDIPNLSSSNINIFSKPQNSINLNITDNNISSIPDNRKHHKDHLSPILQKLKTEYDSIISSKDKEISQYISNLASQNDSLSLQIQTLSHKLSIYQQTLSTSTSPFFLNSHDTTLDSIKKQTNLKTQSLTDNHSKTLTRYQNEFDDVNSFCNSYNISSLQENVISFINELKQHIISYQKQIIELLNKTYEQMKLEIVLTNTKEMLNEENAYLKYKLITEKHNILMEIYNMKRKYGNEIECVKRDFTSQNFIKNNLNVSAILSNRNESKVEVMALHQKVNDFNKERKELYNKVNEIQLKNEELVNKIKELNEMNVKLISEKEINQIKVNKLNTKISDLIQCNNLYQNEICEMKRQLSKKEDNVIELSSAFKVKESVYKNEISQLQNKINLMLSNNNNHIQITKTSSHNNKETLISTLQNDVKLFSPQLSVSSQSNKDKDVLLSKYENDINVLTHTKDNINNELTEIKLYVDKLYDVVMQFDSEHNVVSNLVETKESVIKLKEIYNNMEKVLMYKNNQKEINNKIHMYENEIQKLKNRVNSLINLSLNNANKINNNATFPQNISKLSQIQLYEKIVKYIHDLNIYHEIQMYKLIIKHEENNIIKSNSSENQFSQITKGLNNIENKIKINNDNFNKRINQFILIDITKSKISDIQKQYENIIASLFEKFLAYNISNSIQNDNKFLLLQIPINEYNGIIESAMQSIDYIITSISKWYIDIESMYEKNVNSVYDVLINMTIIKSEMNSN